jgi:signal transduction histidine kinase
MRRRVEELGGTVTLESPPARGTTLRASIPCV